MQGRVRNNISASITPGTIIKNFDFIFCDFIKHPMDSRIKDNIKTITKVINTNLNPKNRAEDIIF